MKPQRIQQLLQEFEDVFASLAIVSVTLQDQTLADQVSEYASEHGGEAITEDSDGDGLYLEYQFEDITEAEEFHEFMIGNDWFGDEVVAVSLHTAEEEHIGDEDDLDMIPIDDDEDELGGRDDMNAHIEQQEWERRNFRAHYIPDVGGFDEETNVFNAQGQGGDVVKNDYATSIQELKKVSHFAAQLTLREFKSASSESKAPDYKMGEPPNVRKFKEYRPVGKNKWKKGKWGNKGSETPSQKGSHPFQKTVNGRKKDHHVHYIKSVIEKKGKGWDAIQRASNQDSDYNDNKFVGDQAWNFHSKENRVIYRKKQGDLKEMHKGESFCDEEFQLRESLDETMDEMSTTAGIGGYTVPLGGKPANMKRNADVWRRNNQSKKPKANDTVKQNLAPTQSATSVKKDRKKAKAPYTSFADQSNIPFKHKSRKSKYGVSDSPASAIGGE